VMNHLRDQNITLLLYEYSIMELIRYFFHNRCKLLSLEIEIKKVLFEGLSCCFDVQKKQTKKNDKTKFLCFLIKKQGRH